MQVLYTPVRLLIDQSLHSRLGAETTNGDGFGVGWYDAVLSPGCSGASSRPGMTRTCARSRVT
jgi:predicted glutamine amidotransferase